ncbi:MAG TPA: DUF4013 domain-containing protein [Anaerolineae bacterium]|nr:DUF4013 domain-containing protein [Anaerolineae bacterium]
MDVGKSIGYVFEDKKWTNKLLIGMLVSIVPIINFALLGWVSDIMRNVSRRQALPLPEWDDFGDKFVKGASLFGAALIYALPALLLFGPLVFLPFTHGDFGHTGRQAFTAMFVGTTLTFMCFVALYGLLLSFLMPAIYLNFSRKGTFAACFEFGEIWRILSHNLGDYIVAWIVSITIGIGVSFMMGLAAAMLAIIPCFGWIAAWVLVGATGVWILAVSGHLFGQIDVGPSEQALISGA